MAAVLLALLDAHPDGPAWARAWLAETLRAQLPGYDENDRRTTLRGWSVGAAWGNETLVQSRPIVRNRDVDPLDDLLRTPASCVVAAFSTHDAASDGIVAPPPVKLSRFRRWLGVRVGPSLPPARATALRDALPGFLSRHQVDRSDGELVFLTFLGHLHNSGELGKTYSPPAAIRTALGKTAEDLQLSPHNFMVSDGRTFAMLHDGGALVSFEPPPTSGGRPARFRVTGEREDGPRTNLLLHTPNTPEEAPHNGGERVGPGVFSVDVRNPRAIER